MSTSDWIAPGYRHVRELGSGAFGRVVLATHLADEMPVAIKYLSGRLLADSEFVTSFRAEARLLAQLRHPHVVQFNDYLETPRGAALVMELVDGASLRQVLANSGPTGPEAALTVLKGSLLGLAAAHAVNVVHRDYKPENVLVQQDGVSKLADFGIAVRAGHAAVAAGTPNYMAPEQWHERTVTPAADVYAATVVFFECLTGRLPHAGQSLTELARAHRTAEIPLGQVPPPVRGLVAHGMAKEPAQRPVSAAAFVQELEQAAVAGYGRDWERRGRAALAGAAALLAALFPLARQFARDGSAQHSPARHPPSTEAALGAKAGAAGGRSAYFLAAGALTTVALVAVTLLFVTRDNEKKPVAVTKEPRPSTSAPHSLGTTPSPPAQTPLGPVVGTWRLVSEGTDKGSTMTIRPDGTVGNKLVNPPACKMGKPRARGGDNYTFVRKCPGTPGGKRVAKATLADPDTLRMTVGYSDVRPGTTVRLVYKRSAVSTQPSTAPATPTAEQSSAPASG